MKKEEVNEVIACLPKERTLFHYFKDRYALMLLSDAARGGATMTSIKRSRLAGLLDKPVVRRVVQGFGDGRLDVGALECAYADDARHFVLTLDSWDGCDGWGQTSRRGYNLVLQLNFSMEHDHQYRELLKPVHEAALNNWNHPVQHDRKKARRFRETLAWARIDLDFDRDEVLIEEIQSDWVRVAQAVARNASRLGYVRHHALSGEAAAVIRYAEQVLAPYARMWDEAMLAAAIHFVRKELGIANVYYHSFETGCRVKGLRYSHPPRSLYTQLPRRFCFERVDQAPQFLASDGRYRRVIKKIAQPEWYRLAF